LSVSYKKPPVAVMVRGILERILGEEVLNQLYDRASDRQYTRELLFSSVFELMNLVVCKVYPSIHAAYQRKQQAIGTSVTAVYDKLSGIDTGTSRALVLETAQQMGEAVRAMKGRCARRGYPATESRCSMATASRRASIGSGCCEGSRAGLCRASR
jgi:hypothetical protein